MILIFLTVFTFVLLNHIKNPAPSQIDAQGRPVAAAHALFASTDQPPPPGRQLMNIKVIGQQYSWNLLYPQARRQAGLRLQRHVRAGRHDRDARHRVGRRRALVVDPGARRQGRRDPGLHEQDVVPIPLDAIPRADSVVYKGQCAELCGRNHADMLARVIGLRYDDWKAWYDSKAEQLQQAQDEAAAERKKLNAEEGR